ncbi:conserved exported hypothetical protein [Bradyrhizobium oligotrophicum S58]|uniref:Uncharacterized protein n=1 Tax=Bradyrhizobium oligotrophicum S58 TaxID=1245469 RepID=M4ZRS1_9BRAD|nr:hypothetical protein [Bradyrhizobium oligotrophicum]BAM88930.1 conserved exported hypothetical protein [Bradyrhizobium oligotrophicum S58]
MRLVRTIIAFAIALSLTMLPIGASAGGVVMSSDDMQTSMHMGDGSDMSMDECCPDGMKGQTSPAHSTKCGMGFCCAGGTVALGDVRVVTLAPIAMTATTVALPADQVVSLHSGSPPFRPPRI